MSAGPMDGEEQLLESVDGPGHRLRLARQARGLQIERLANQLHLKPSVVEALERDDYAPMPSPVFVKGYITNYARLLDLPADPLLAAYARLQPKQEGPAAPVCKHAPSRMPSRMPARAAGGHRLLNLLVGLLVLVLLGAGGYWANKQFHLVPAGAPDMVPAVPSAAAVEEVPEELPPSLKAFLEQESAAAAEPAPAKVPVAESVADVQAPTAVSALPEQTPAASAAQPTKPAAADEGDAAPPDAAEAGPQVVLELLGSCWVDIRDANGKNKIIGELSKGDRRSLEGKPPFSVVLGNSRAVRILVDGEPYDIAQHARGNVARFKLQPDDGGNGG